MYDRATTSYIYNPVIFTIRMYIGYQFVCVFTSQVQILFKYLTCLAHGVLRSTLYE